MGREVKRVPLDFVFPVDASWHDTAYEQHHAVCAKCRDDEDGDGCGFDANGSVPKGDGWQLWQTVSDGPVTPVFPTADALIDWMCQPVPPNEQPSYDRTEYPSMPAGKGWRREVAEPFVKEHGWAPSMIVTGDGRVLNGADAIVRQGRERR